MGFNLIFWNLYAVNTFLWAAMAGLGSIGIYWKNAFLLFSSFHQTGVAFAIKPTLKGSNPIGNPFYGQGVKLAPFWLTSPCYCFQSLSVSDAKSLICQQ